MTQIYVSIGNSDDKLSQEEWYRFCDDLVTVLGDFADQTYGQWYSLPNAKWQNMVASIEIADNFLDDLRDVLRQLAEEYRQDSIALQAGTAEFIAPTGGDVQ
jgi:hypothetical protein